jgi:hypothetical protein
MEVQIDYRWRHDDKWFTFRLTYLAQFHGRSLDEITRLDDVGYTSVVGAKNAFMEWMPGPRDCQRLLLMFDLDFERHRETCHQMATDAAWNEFWDRKQG